MEQLKQDADRAERDGDYGLVAEIRYGKLKEQEALISKLNADLQEMDSHQRNRFHSYFHRKQRRRNY